MVGVEIIGLMAASAALVDLLLKFGDELVIQVRRLRHPESLVADLNVFTIEAKRMFLRRQIAHGYQMMRSARYDDDLKQCLSDEFEQLQEAIIAAEALVTKLLDKSVTKPFVEAKYRKKIAEAISLIKTRSRDFMDEIQLNHIVEAQPSFAALIPDVFAVPPELGPDVTQDVKVVRCHLSTAIGRVAPRHTSFVLETRRYNPGTKDNKKREVEKLAEILATAEKSPAILDCLGYTDLPASSHLALVFALPEEQRSYDTLKNIIDSSVSPPSLTVRVELCRALADAVLHVHSLKNVVVHKNITTSNVLVSFPSDQPQQLSRETFPIFLLNWRMSRPASGATNFRRATDWWDAIYQHPTRQEEKSESSYTLNHDIYSLGVCMIEVLLWKRLATKNTSGRVPDGLIFERGVQPPELGVDAQLDPTHVNKVLTSIAETEVLSVGNKLSDLVVRCLEGFPEPNREYGNLFISGIKDTLDRLNI